VSHRQRNDPLHGSPDRMSADDGPHRAIRTSADAPTLGGSGAMSGLKPIDRHMQTEDVTE
jgi:hypothetical protein